MSQWSSTLGEHAQGPAEVCCHADLEPCAGTAFFLGRVHDRWATCGVQPKLTRPFLQRAPYICASKAGNTLTYRPPAGLGAHVS